MRLRKSWRLLLLSSPLWGVLALVSPATARGQRLAPVGVLRVDIAPDAEHIAPPPQLTPGQQGYRIVFGIVSGAALGAAAAYVWSHSPMSGPDEGSRPYRVHIPAFAVAGGLMAAVGWWGCVGPCGPDYHSIDRRNEPWRGDAVSGSGVLRRAY